MTSEPFEVEVVKNFLPVVNNQAPDTQIELNVLWTNKLPIDTFLDPNGDDLTYSVTEDTSLPDWLSFTPSSRTFVGVPTEYA